MASYPAHKISSPDMQVNVLQLTDLHLSMPKELFTADRTQSNCQQSFEQVVKQALDEDIRCDLILVTGDLVNQVNRTIYDHIFAVLQRTQIPFACIAGNHDVTDELYSERPFFQRELVPQPADPRLLNQHVIETDYWQILLLDSAVAGKVAGKVQNKDIEWLCSQLSTSNKPALLALHHHVLPMQSEWIDDHIAQNAEVFWQRISPFKHLSAIISGHTHQEQVRCRQGVTVYSTPSTCYQFKPYEDDFAYDKNARPGYRWLQLANNGSIVSWVKRLDT
ncbi:metallophosphoesterase [Psychrobacter jeotgali]|uniref:metallophosphoesterase n=1 Tax=Psychrobacter jeotgali TaxID=179010 RepID=UPI00191B5155|nr:metallophosphoesterase [Psychrobacter jeotgali]